jgi:hypothetical protein
MRVKILDAFARGVPVVTTPVGIEGIRAVAGVHALIESHPDLFAESVLRVINNESVAASLAVAARTLVTHFYDLPVVQQLQLQAIRTCFRGG